MPLKTKKPSITRQLLLKSLNYPREYTDVTDEEIEIILACMKSILADNRRTWLKSHVDNFDIPMVLTTQPRWLT